MLTLLETHDHLSHHHADALVSMMLLRGEVFKYRTDTVESRRGRFRTTTRYVG